MNTLKLPHMLACVFALSENSHCILFISKKLMFQGHWNKNSDLSFMDCLHFKELIEI